MKSPQTAPIACTLDASRLKDRLQWIAGLNAAALRTSRRDGLVLTLVYDASAIDDVRRMVEGERSCCAFLTFDVATTVDAVTVRITAPQDARESADALFGPLQKSEKEALLF